MRRGGLSLAHRRVHPFPREGGRRDALPDLRLGQLVVDAEVAVPWRLRALPRDGWEPRHHGGGSEVGGEGLVRHSFHCLNTVAGVRCDRSPHIAAQGGRRRRQVVHCRHTGDLGPRPRVHTGVPRSHLAAVGRAQHLLVVRRRGTKVVIVSHGRGGLQVGALAGQVQVPSAFCEQRNQCSGAAPGVVALRHNPERATGIFMKSPQNPSRQSGIILLRYRCSFFRLIRLNRFALGRQCTMSRQHCAANVRVIPSASKRSDDIYQVK